MINEFCIPSSPDRKARRFSLSSAFLAEFEGQQPKWGPVGYFTYKRCVDVSTPVLCDDLQWRPAGDIEVGQGIVGFDSEPKGGRGQFRHLRHGIVLHNKVEKAHTLGVELEDGTIIYATPDHGWLVKLSETDNRLYWKETKDLAGTRKGGSVHLLRPFGPVWEQDKSHEAGFLSAAYDGEDCLDRNNSIQFIQVGNPMLARVEQFLTQKGVSYTKAARKKVEGRQQVFSLRTSGRKKFYTLLGALQPPRLMAKFTERLKSKGGGALRTSPEDYVKVVRVFDAGERDIAVLSTSTETHFTGGFASHNTYARPTCDCNDPNTCGHPTEEFWQTCRRVVEGVYNVQKIHCRRLSLPWNEPKAQGSAQEMYQRMWDFKFTPPGRGLAQMGASFMFKKGGAALNNPLHEDTPVLTREHGWVPIGSLANMEDVTLLSSIKLYGRDHTSTAASSIWTKASMSHVEVQPCKRIVLRDNSGFVTEIVASENHRWFRRESVKKEWERVTTLDLNEGDQFPVVLPAKVAPVSHFGAQHGMFFGDGTRPNGELHQFGDSVPVLRDLFGSLAAKVDHRREDEWVVRNCPRSWAQIPTSPDDVSYIYGFLAGYFAADGCVAETGSCSVSSARRSELEEVRRLFQAVGVRVGDIRLSSTSSNYSDERELWTMTPHLHDLWDGFFLRTDHRERWSNRGQEPKRKYARVLHIEDAGDQRVLCAVVPDYEQFVIDGFVLTSNCAFTSSDGIGEDFAGPFTFLMDMSMLGVGVGGDTRGTGKVKIGVPRMAEMPHVVSDDREGWVALARTVLNSFVGKGSFPQVIDFSRVRPKGKRIRGFGGTASGPGPLAKLIKGIVRTLMPAGVEVQFEESFSRKGKIMRLETVTAGEGAAYRIRSTNITDIFNMVGACVVAGGVRRSAEIMFGQPDDLDFRALKDPTTLKPLDSRMETLQTNLLAAPVAARAGIQAEIDELQGQIDLHPLRSHRWASNNSIFGDVGMDYGDVAQSIAKNGEPGIFWLDNARRFGRMVDPANNKDRRAQGANPCVTGDTIIFTTGGPRRADKMLAKPFRALVDGKHYECKTGVFQTGVKPVYQLQTKEGHGLRVTADHQILTAPKVTRKKRYEMWAEVQDLVPGDRVVLNNVRTCEGPGDEALPLEWDGMGTFEQGWVLGNLLGDGHFKADQETGVLQFWGSTKQEMLGLALQRIETLGGDPRYHGQRTGTDVDDRDMVSTKARQAWLMAPEFGIAHNKDITNDTVLTASSKFQQGLLRGFFDADGSVQGDQQKGVSVRLGLANRQHLAIVQKMLMNFGINSTIYNDRREAGSYLLPDGKGGEALYDCKAMHELVISNDNIWVFADRIGFDEPERKAKLTGLLDSYKRRLNRDRFVAEVESVNYVGIEPVFDCTVDEVHRFGANGITVHNCCEQTLESFEACCLVETYPAHHDTYEDFQRTLKFAYLYAKTVTLMPTHDPRTNAVMNRNRRIGCSMSGIRQAIERIGRREFLNWCDRGYHYIGELDTLYSEWLGIPLSIKTTSVKPSGCRPWYALTSTNQGLLTLEDLFEHHPVGQEWAEQPDHELEALRSGIISKTYDNGVAPVLRITTSYGIEVESTPNHQWWVTQRYDRKKKHKYQDVGKWRRADEIQPGDILDIKPGVYNMEGGADLAPLNSLALNMRGDATEIQQPEQMNPRLAWLLGYLWGDGAMSPSKYRLRWVDARRENLEKAQAILKEQFGLDAHIKQASEHRKAETLEVGSKHLWHWLIRNDVFKLYADKIDIIPKVVRASGHEEVLAFLAGLLDADGCTSKSAEDSVLIWTTADPDFARHVQNVALAVGVVVGRSHVTGGTSFQKHRSMFHLTASGHTSPHALAMLRRHSTKIVDHETRPDFVGWRGEVADRKGQGLILGKVLKVESVGKMPTFDVEVVGDHWYYAGAIRSHNTVSLLCGATPGIHPPHSPFYIRNIRINEHSPLRQAAIAAGYKVEKDAYADGTFVISFPVATEDCTKGKQDVSIWEQVALAADLQRYWADNQVSVTVTFKPEEAAEIPTVLEVFEDRLKAISFLPLKDDHGYVQAPYIAITEDSYRALVARTSPMDLTRSKQEVVDSFCDGETCQIDFGKPD